MSKITFMIEYAGLQLQVVKNEAGEDVTPLKPISDLFGLKWEKQRLKVTEGGYWPRFLGTCTPPGGGAGGQIREQNCILLSRVTAYLMSINPEQVRVQGNADGAEFLMKKQEEWADALHDYEQLGAAVNLNHVKVIAATNRQRMQFAQMMGIKNKAVEAADRKAMSQIMKQMAAELAIAYQPDLLDS